MRIAAGVLKGFPIVYPRNRAFRPTQEKVRAAVFNIIQDRLSGAEFLDLCCGTGAMGLEALSRGAQSITLVDMDVRYAGQNRDDSVSRLLPEIQADYRRRITVVRASARDFIRRARQQFDFIFMDPPWDREALFPDTLRLLGGSDILRPGGSIICERPTRMELALPDSLHVRCDYFYGDTIVSIIQWREGVHAHSNLSR